MVTEVIDIQIKGGAASGGPPLGPALGPTGIKISEVVDAINQKTADMKGMDVPVKVTIDKDTKTFEISIGTPPTSALLKKELGLSKGSQTPGSNYVADAPFNAVLKVAKIKLDTVLAYNLKAAVKEVLGSCRTIGIKVEGMTPQEAITAVNAGKWDSQISNN